MAITKSDAESLVQQLREFKSRKEAIQAIANSAELQPDGSYRINTVISAEVMELLVRSSA